MLSAPAVRKITRPPGFAVRAGAGLRARIDPDLHRIAYLEDVWPASETRYRAAYSMRLDRLALADGDGFDHLVAYREDGVTQVRLRLKRVDVTWQWGFSKENVR